MVALFLPEPERKVVPMDVCNVGRTDPVHDYVVCIGYVGDYLLKTQIKTATPTLASSVTVFSP